MLDNLLHIATSLNSFDTETEIIKIVSDNSGEITNLQREQLSYGVGKDGKPRIDEYRPLTKYLKQKNGVGLGRVIDRVTFFMTGQLYNSLKTEVKGPTYQTISNLETYTKMIERIGQDNYGLSPDQRYEFATEYLLPDFAKVFESKTSIKIKI